MKIRKSIGHRLNSGSGYSSIYILLPVNIYFLMSQVQCAECKWIKKD